MTATEARPAPPLPPATSRKVRGGGGASGGHRHVKGRITGALAAVLGVCMVVAAVATGTGLPKAVTELRDVGAWLADSALGSVTHAEGPSGLADARVNLRGTRGDRLRIVQSGSTVLVQDTRTGEVYRIDPAQLTVTQSASYGQSGIQVVASGMMAYVIAPAAGLVQRIDAQTLSVVGTPLRLGTRVGAAAIDGRGTLWLALPDRGAVMPVRDGVGGVLDIGKYRPRLPGGHPKPSTAGPQSAPALVTGTAPGSPPPASPGPPPGPASASPSRSPSPTPSPSGSTSASPSPSPTGTPQPPGAPTASSGDGVITVTFTPSSGATPLDYTLIGAPSGATVTPASVPAGGPFSFTVSGLDCAQTYAFAVAANYSGAGGSLQSPMTAAMRPCVAPSAPQSLSVTATANHRMTLGWSAPASPGGGAVSYTVAWSGPVSGSAANLTGTSYQITGLQNSQTYSYSVTANSPAGSSQPATGSQALTPPQQALNFHNNNSCTSLVNVRASPTQSSQSLAQVPGCTPVGGTGVGVTVYCQVTGSTATDNLDPSLSGDIWDKVTWNGINGWVNDIYIDTPQSNAGNFNAYSDPPLWQCS